MKFRSVVQSGFGWALAAVLLLAGSSFQLSATPIFYVATQGNGLGVPGGGVSGGCPIAACGSSLGQVDAATGAISNFVLISGLAANEELFDIAVNAAGEVYGTTQTRLYKINPASGAATLVLQHNGAGLNSSNTLVGGGTFNGLAFLGNTLYASGNSGYTFSINLNTNEVRSLSDTPIAFQSNGDIAGMGNRLYIATTTSQIISIDLLGNLQDVGPTGLTNSGGDYGGFKGLAVDGGFLYLVAACSPGGCSGNESLVQIDVGSGNFGVALSAVLYNGGSAGAGVAAGLPGGMTEFVGVPEPSTYFLSAIGLGLVGLARRKRK